MWKKWCTESNYFYIQVSITQTFREHRLDGTHLKRRDRQRLIVLVQGDERKEGRDSTIFLFLHQWRSIDQHFNFHGLVTDKRELASHCHHTALGRWEKRGGTWWTFSTYCRYAAIKQISITTYQQGKKKVIKPLIIQFNNWNFLLKIFILDSVSILHSFRDKKVCYVKFYK